MSRDMTTDTRLFTYGHWLKPEGLVWHPQLVQSSCAVLYLSACVHVCCAVQHPRPRLPTLCSTLDSPDCIHVCIPAVAIRRLYERIRCQYLSHQPQKAQQQDLKNKYRARRERVRALLCCSYLYLVLLTFQIVLAFTHCSFMHGGLSMFRLSIGTSGRVWIFTTCRRKKMALMHGTTVVKKLPWRSESWLHECLVCCYTCT